MIKPGSLWRIRKEAESEENDGVTYMLVIDTVSISSRSYNIVLNSHGEIEHRSLEFHKGTLYVPIT